MSELKGKRAPNDFSRSNAEIISKCQLLCKRRRFATISLFVFFVVCLYYISYLFEFDWWHEKLPTGFLHKNISACNFTKNIYFANDGRKFLDKGSMGVRSKTISFETLSVFYGESLPSASVEYRGDVLLLHGAAYSSDTWDKLGTMEILADSGFRVVAIDLPGFHRKTTGSYDPQLFLTHLASKLHLNRPAVVSPSASGRFSLPFLFSGLASAFVAIAPVGTDKFLLQSWEKMNTPIMIVHGDLDKMKPSTLLLSTPNHVFHMLNAGHSVYLNQTKTFHILLLNFFNYLTTRKNDFSYCNTKS